MTHTELIDQIRQGTPLENDIDDVDLLNKVLHEASHPICEATGRYKFYFLNGDDWCSTDEQKPNAIKLSAFKTKMVSVEALEAFIEENMFGVGYIDCVSLFQFIKDNKQ